MIREKFILTPFAYLKMTRVRPDCFPTVKKSTCLLPLSFSGDLAAFELFGDDGTIVSI